MTMKKPDQVLPNRSTTSASPMPNVIPDPSIRGVSFDQLLKHRGIKFMHKRATPCPNLRSLDDNTHDPECPICDNNGFLYYDEREIIGIFQGNSLERLFEQQGMWEIGQAIITFPAEYDDGTQADFNQFDQLVITGHEVRLWEMKEYEPRTGNKQALRYPITSIDHMSSVENGVHKVYVAGTDYNIVGGEIEWVSGKEPAYDATNERGSVFSVAYYANPVYVVQQTMRELRVTQEYVNGQKVARRLPQEVMVKRDFLRNDAEKIQT